MIIDHMFYVFQKNCETFLLNKYASIAKRNLRVYNFSIWCNKDKDINK